MSQSYQQCLTPIMAHDTRDTELRVEAGVSAPSLQTDSRACGAALPEEPRAGAAAVSAVLASHPIADFYYQDFTCRPSETTRDALFTAYLGDWAGFNELLRVIDDAARAERAALTPSERDADRANQLGALRAGFAAGKRAFRAMPSQWELDVLLGLVERDPAGTADFVVLAYEGWAANLGVHLVDRVRHSFPDAPERMSAALQFASACGAQLATAVVQRNDTLETLSARHLGDPTRHRELAAYNGLSVGAALQEGLLLLLPAASPASTIAPTPEAGPDSSDTPESLQEDAPQLSPAAEQVLGYLDGDWAGRALLARYLTGGGDWTIQDDPAWTAYMQENTRLRVEVYGELTRIVQERWPILPAAPQEFGERVHLTLENGEDAVGYQYLHGSNPAVGDFEIEGRATACPSADASLVDVTARYTWNDQIDPNPRYTTDRAKNAFAALITLGAAKPYTLAITWSTSCTIEHVPSQDFCVIYDGWPAPGA